jgi:error-prone DNA polymerase
MRTCVRVAYVELHCHSAFSFLDGASLPDELVAAALELGHEALALTDHNSVSGSMEFAVAAGALGLRPIHGAEIDLEPDGSRAGRHLTLLVEDATGTRTHAMDDRARRRAGRTSRSRRSSTTPRAWYA